MTGKEFMYKKYKLKSGLNVILSHMPAMESISLGIWIGVGGRYEHKRYCGISHLIEHMLFKGTTSKTANDLKESIEGVGGNFNGFTSEEVTCYLVKLPSAYMELGLDVLSDMVLNPELNPVELEKEKHVICEEIKMYMDQPAHQVLDILAETMWPRHALGRPIAGYIDTVRRFKREDLKQFMQTYYHPSNISIVAAGRLDHPKTLSLIRNMFSTPRKKGKSLYDLKEKIKKGNDIKIFRKNTKQTHVALGFHSVHRTHGLRYALTLLNIILGGNMSSRLFERLRERKALCYDISSSVKKYKETGAFVIHAGVDNHKLLEATSEMVNEIKNIKKEAVSEDELYRAKEYFKGQLLLALEDTASRMLWLGDKIVIEGKAPSVREIFKKIEKTNIEDIREASNIIFGVKNMSFATVGPARPKYKLKLRKTLGL